MLHPRLNSDVLLCAAILHDVGKIHEFELGADIELSEAGALVGHVALGQQLVVERARNLDGFPDAKLHAVSHCILAHHGPEAAPGRRFRSVEALALYRLNALDAGVKGALEQRPLNGRTHVLGAPLQGSCLHRFWPIEHWCRKSPRPWTPSPRPRP